MLPRLFKKFRFKIPEDARPTVVLYFDPKREKLIPQLPDLQNELRTLRRGTGVGVGDVPVVVYDNCWYEYRDGAYQMRVVEGQLSSGPQLYPTGPLTAELVAIDVYDPVSGLLDSFTANPMDPMAQLEGLPPELKQARSIILAELFRACCYLWLIQESPRRISTDTKTRIEPAVYTKRGDTFAYDRLDALRSVPASTYTRPEQPSGIKKREHEVIGHWRTYKSGVRVWVRGHKRGDPALGKVTKIRTL